MSVEDDLRVEFSHRAPLRIERAFLGVSSEARAATVDAMVVVLDRGADGFREVRCWDERRGKLTERRLTWLAQSVAATSVFGIPILQATGDEPMS